MLLVVLLFALLLPRLGLAATVNAASCSPAAITTAIAAAASGDTVHLPSCTYTTWTGTVSITKRIILEGNGTANTVLQRSAVPSGSASPMFQVVNVTGFEMRNLTLDGTQDTNPDTWEDFGVDLVTAVDFRLHHMAFTNLAVGIQVRGNPLVQRGLIDHNTFVNCYYNHPTDGPLGYGVVVYGDDTYPALALGTAQNIFIEDNTLSTGRHAVASNAGSRYVFRYNTVLNYRENASAIDAHGVSSFNRGSRQYEIYENTVNNSVPRFAGVGIRGGDGVVFNNRFSTNITSEILLLNDGGCTGTYPKPDQIRDLYIWGNTLLEGGAAPIVNNCPAIVQLDRDYRTTARPGYGTGYPYPHPGQGGASPVPDVSSGLRMHLKFDEATGTTAEDATVNNQDGTLATGATWGAPQMGASAVVFDGTVTGKVTVTGGLTNPTSATLAAWVFPTGWPVANNDVINIRNALVLRLLNSGSVRGSFYTGTGYSGMTVDAGLALNTWHHIAYTVTPGTQKVYINGVERGSGSSGSTVTYTGLPADTVIGSHLTDPTNFRFQGAVDDVRVYTRALSATDIAGLAALEDPPPLSILITTHGGGDSASTSSALLANLGGIAVDNLGVTGITWNCSTCTPTSGAGTCTPACGAAATDVNWNIPAITLAAGSNLVTVTAADASGTRSDTLTVTYTPVTTSACTHYASPSGGGNGLSQGSPFQVIDFWAVATPGKVVCLLDGTYTGGNSLIKPPATFAGTSSQPITIRALNDGKAHIAGGTTRPVHLQGRWGILDGVNVSGGDNAAIGGLDADDWVVRRVVVWNNGDAAPAGQMTLISIHGQRLLLEDWAGFGKARKIFQAGKDGNLGRRVLRGWARFEECPSCPDGNPTNAFEVGYDETHVSAFNNLSTRHEVGRNTSPEMAFNMFSTTNTTIQGHIAYVMPTYNYVSPRVLHIYPTAGSHPGQTNTSNSTITDSVAIIAPGHPGFGTKRAYSIGGTPGSGNVATNVVGIAGLDGECDGSWSCVNLKNGRTVAEATGGQSIWTVVPGICKRYATDGTLTTEGLWPGGQWPMNQRILDAMVLSGRTPVNVTNDLVSLFGPIPASCQTGTVAEACTPPLVGTPPNCTCPAGTIPPNCDPETPAATCPPECPVQDVFVIATTGSPGPAGSDANACTLDAPCSTIARARSLMTPGDTLYLRGGIYTGSANRIDTSTGAFPPGNDASTPTKLAGYASETAILQQTSGTVLAFINPATDRYLVLDRLTCDGAASPSNDTQCLVLAGGVHHIRLQNSTLRNTHFAGLSVADSAAIAVVDTTIYGSTHSSGAVVTGASDSVLFDRVTVHSNAVHGLTAAHSGLTNLTVTNSIAHSNGGTGFQLRAASLLATNLLAHTNALGLRLLSGAADARLLFLTLADNSGAEVQIDAGATATVVTNVLAVGEIVDNGTGTVQTTTSTGDPGFVGAGDYRLALDTSPAVNTGTCLPGVVESALDGVLRPQPVGGACDIGAYERPDLESPELPPPGPVSARPWGARMFLVP